MKNRTEAASQQLTYLARRYLARQTKTPVGDIHLRINHQFERFLRVAEPYKYVHDVIRLIEEANAYSKGRIVCTSREMAVAVLLSRDAVLDSRFPAPDELVPMPTLPENYQAKEWEDLTVVAPTNLLRLYTGRKMRDVEHE